MMKIKKIKIYINGDNKSKSVKDILIKKLINKNFEIVNDNYDIAISIGGDGTFLKMVHESNFNNNYGEIVPIKGNIIEKYDMTNEKRDINLFNNSIKANNEVNAEIDNNTWESIN